MAGHAEFALPHVLAALTAEEKLRAVVYLDDEVRPTGDAIKMILLDVATQGIEEPILDVTLKLQRVLKVRAIDLLTRERAHEATALVLIAKTEQRRHMPGKRVVRLVVKLVSIRY